MAKKTTKTAKKPIENVTEVAPKKDSPLRLEWLDPATLSPNPANWRKHPAGQAAALKDLLAEVGWAGVLLYNERTKRLIDGHLRKEIASGKPAPVVIGDWSEEQERKILATLDPVAAMAEGNKTALKELLASVETESASVNALLDKLASENTISRAALASETEELLEDDTDNAEAEFLAPFPWFGGKSRVARAVWKRFGQIGTFIEPFFGSGAMLLNRPLPFEGNETVNDFDGLVCNFWRAVQADPEAVAKWADWPVNENDANARHFWLVERKDSLQAKLEGDPEYFDAKIAGWWCWGMACWIGSGFCSGEGPWRVEEVDGVRQLVHLSNAGRGVNRQLVHLSDAGRGVNRKLVHLSGAGQGAKPGRGDCGLVAWMKSLSDRLRRVRVCCGDWTRICGGNSGDALGHMLQGTCGVFLDPPYADTAGRNDTLYRKESLSVAHAVREWAIAHGDDSRLRIALCGYEGEHKMPDNWLCLGWKAKGGMSSVADGGQSQANENAHKERVWFSPHCLKV